MTGCDGLSAGRRDVIVNCHPREVLLLAKEKGCGLSGERLEQISDGIDQIVPKCPRCGSPVYDVHSRQ